MKNNLNMILLMVILLVVGIFVGQKLNPSSRKINDGQQQAVVSGTASNVTRYTEKQLAKLGATLDVENTAKLQNDYNNIRLNNNTGGSSLYTYNCYGFNIQGQGIFQQWVSSSDLGIGFTLLVFNGSSTLYCSQVNSAQ